MAMIENRLFEAQNNYYVATSQGLFSAPSLTGTHETDTVIIGGGLAGLAVAIGLLERGVSSVTLIESHTIGYGASGRNGGFVFGGYSLAEKSLLRQLGSKEGRWAYQLTSKAIGIIRARAQRYNIDCDMCESGIILANCFNESKALKSKQRWMADKLDAHWEWLSRDAIQQQLNTDFYHNGLFEKNAFHMHPLKYVQGLARAFTQQCGSCFENTPATSLHADTNGVTITTPSGKIKANQCVIACGGYMGTFYPRLRKSLLPISTYVMVTEPLGKRLSDSIRTNAAVYDTRFAFDYYRPLPDQRLLWGGRISIQQREPEQIKRFLKKDLMAVFPELADVDIDYAWGGLMAYPLQKMPLLGLTQSKVWHITGFGGHGVGPTTVGGELIAQAITQSNHDYRRLNRYRPRYAMGIAGLFGAQMTYWGMQMLDWIKMRKHS